MRLIDTHIHFEDDRLLSLKDELIEEAVNAGIGYFINVSSEFKKWEDMLKFLEDYDFIYGAFGVHPHDARYYKDVSKFLTEILSHRKVVALGEVGFDFYYMNSEKKDQIYALMEQLEMACDMKLPVIFHIRDAYSEFFKEVFPFVERNKMTCIFHCFSGSINDALKILELENTYLGFTGVVTFKNAKKVVDVALNTPVERIMIETDAPYLAPHPYRGKVNKPLYLLKIFEKLVELKKMDPDELSSVLLKNAQKCFKINLA